MLIQNLFWNYWLKIVINCCVTIHLVLTEKFSQKMILHNVLNIFLGPFKIVITDKFYSLNSSWCNVPACAQNKIPSDSICWPPAENRRHARRLQKLNYWPSNKKRSRCEFGHSFVHSLDSSTQKALFATSKVFAFSPAAAKFACKGREYFRHDHSTKSVPAQENSVLRIGAPLN